MWKWMMALCLVAGQAAAEVKQVVLAGRSYVIDLPARPTGAMIVALHNASGDPAEFRDAILLTGPALAQGYAVIYPQGTGNAWNGFYCCWPAQQRRTPDIQFLDTVIADAAGRFGLDAGRVYLTGMGNGSIMAETYAARRAGKVKAVAGVAGTVDLGRTPAAAVPMLHIHGTADTVTPYGIEAAGVGTKRRRGTFPTVPLQIEAFVRAHGGLAKTSRVIDRVNDGTTVRQDDYTDARGRVQVRLLSIQQGGHVWPGPQRKGKGNTRDISATAEALRFFALHP